MVAPPAIQDDNTTPEKKPAMAPRSLTHGTRRPRVKTPMTGPLVTPPTTSASSSIPGMNLTA